MKTVQELNSLALRTRRIWSEDSYSPIDIFAIVQGWKEKKITLIKYPMSSRISGTCTKEKDDIIISINSTMSYGRQRFTLAHELYHALYENNQASIICSMSINGTKTESEREADLFASYLLMPFDALSEYSYRHGPWTLEQIIDAEQFFQISHQAMINRLVSDKYIPHEQAEAYRYVKITLEAVKSGYDKSLYSPSGENQKYFTTGEYIRKVESMVEKKLISEGRKEELLLDAYRADIVYNLDEEEFLPND